MKKYTYEVLKGIIEAHIEYQLEYAFNKGEAAINQLTTIHEITTELSHGFELPFTEKYTFKMVYAVDVNRVGIPPFDEDKYIYKEEKITFINYQEINILEVLNKVDGMLIEATTPYFG